MMKYLISDLAQRCITGNKWEQRAALATFFKKVDLGKGQLVLDFGCGTGLFYPTVASFGARYVGYDIDPEMLRFAAKRYERGAFTPSKDRLESIGRFDLILANCCFHHIDIQGAHEEIAWLASILKEGGTLLFIDIIAQDSNEGYLHRLFMSLEDGEHVRPRDESLDILRTQFSDIDAHVYRSHAFSLPLKCNPFYNDLIVAFCKKNAPGSES